MHNTCEKSMLTQHKSSPPILKAAYCNAGLNAFDRLVASIITTGLHLSTPTTRAKRLALTKPLLRGRDGGNKCKTSHNMSQLNSAMTSHSISPGITSSAAIPSIYAKDNTFNNVGRDQIFITNNYNVDPNCNKGIWTNQPEAQTHHFV